MLIYLYRGFKMSKLQLDRSTKELLEDTADYFGCKPDVIRDVWEATLIVWLLKYSQDEKSLKSIPLPYIGTLGLRSQGESINNETNKIESNFDTFIALNDQFKDLLKEASNNGSSKIAELYQEKIKKIASLIM